MRDIDFEELDKAVNRFLVGDKDKNQTEIEAPKIEKVEEKPAENASKMVFARRNPVDAGNFHAGLISPAPKIEEPKIEKIEENSTDEIEKISVKIEKAEVAIKDNFKEKSKREMPKKHDVLNDNFGAPKMKFEEPILEATFEAPSFENEKIEADFDAKNDDSEVKIVEEIPQKMPAREIIIPERPGVHQIESQEELVIFGAKNAEKSDEKMNSAEEIESEKIEENAILADDSSEKIEVRKENSVDEKIEKALSFDEKVAEELKSESEDFSMDVPKISEEKIEAEKSDEIVNILVKTDENSGEKSEKLENSSEISNEKSEISTRVISEKISSEEIKDIKTPFVANPKIEKRPLGAPASAAPMNLDIKPADRSRNIRRAKMESPVPAAPILSRDEYQEPVVYKKRKSGWGVVLAIILILIFSGAGFGFAWMYFNGGF